MNRYEIRDLDDARTFLIQGLWFQRSVQPGPLTVKPALEWAMEIISQGKPMPPIGFIADLGQVALGMDWESRSNREKLVLPNLPPQLLPTYEDHVLGKIYADWTFSTAGDALRRYREGRDRARGLAFIINQLCERAEFAAVDFSPGVITCLLSEPPEEVLRQGFDSLQREGPDPHLIPLYESLITGARRMAEVLGPEDILELQSGTALDDEGDRLAFRQVASAATHLEGRLPRQRVRPLPRRQEVPTRVLDEDTYPVGGFSSISNRGTVESLLHSQLAYIDEEEQPDLFDIKFLRDELLYYSRDENQFLRRRRTFVLAFYPDLAEAIRFKDAELSYQRGIVLLALLFVLVRKLEEWLSTDALVFEFVFVIPEGQPREFPLESEYELLIRLLGEQAANGSVVFNFLFLAPEDPSRSQTAVIEEMKQRLRDRLPRGKINFSTFPTLEAVENLCSERARRSLCHCLAMSTGLNEIEPQDTVVTHMLLDGPAPSLAAGWETPVVPEGEDAMESWSAALEQILRRWI
jgi:hypothetical protein